jgi:2-hydroxy-3-oxopropionate reductase
MTTIAFVGLGIMGQPMSIPAEAGFDVLPPRVNLSPERLQPLVDVGGRACIPRSGGGQGADVVAGDVPDSPDVEQVLTGEGGVFDQRRARHPGDRLLQHPARPSPRPSADQARARGLPDARRPVSGAKGCRRRVLSIIVGATRRTSPRRSRSSTRVGEDDRALSADRAGRPVKAANQLIVASTSRCSPRRCLPRGYGVDTEAAIEVLGGGPGRLQGAGTEEPNMLDADVRAGFRIDLHHKDMGIVTSAAREAGVVIPGRVAAQLMASARPTATADSTTRTAAGRAASRDATDHQTTLRETRMQDAARAPWRF